MISYSFSKINEKPLQQAVSALFLSVCKDCGVSIKQNPAFIGCGSVSRSLVERLLQLDTTIPSVMSNDDQCTVRPAAGRHE